MYVCMYACMRVYNFLKKINLDCSSHEHLPLSKKGYWQFLTNDYQYLGMHAHISTLTRHFIGQLWKKPTDDSPFTVPWRGGNKGQPSFFSRRVIKREMSRVRKA